MARKFKSRESEVASGRVPNRAAPESPSAPRAPAAYVVDLQTPGFDGIVKMVEFIDGVGILSNEVIAKNRPDWFKKGEQVSGIKIETYVVYWRDKAARVDPLTAEALEPAMKRIRGRKWRTSPVKDKKKEAGGDDK